MRATLVLFCWLGGLGCSEVVPLTDGGAGGGGGGADGGGGGGGGGGAAVAGIAVRIPAAVEQPAQRAGLLGLTSAGAGAVHVASASAAAPADGGTVVGMTTLVLTVPWRDAPLVDSAAGDSLIATHLHTS